MNHIRSHSSEVWGRNPRSIGLLFFLALQYLNETDHTDSLGPVEKRIQ